MESPSPTIVSVVSGIFLSIFSKLIIRFFNPLCWSDLFNPATNKIFLFCKCDLGLNIEVSTPGVIVLLLFIYLRKKFSLTYSDEVIIFFARFKKGAGKTYFTL